MEHLRKYVIMLLLLASGIACSASEKPTYVSLGGACASAMNLRALNLRNEAYPFDWITSNFAGLFLALETDFAFFLTDLKTRPDRTGVIDYYNFSFTHDWPTIAQTQVDAANCDFVGCNILSPDWEAVLPQVIEKYDRRINRFRVLCEGTEKVFFIRSEYITKSETIALRDLLCTKYPSLDFELVVIATARDFEIPWNIDRIKNFRAEGNDVAAWKKILSTLTPELFQKANSF